MNAANHPNRFWSLFFEVYEPLPRQGPGNRSSAERAFRLCDELPSNPAVLDIGCGAGGQTLHLAEFTNESILALDNHALSITRLQETLHDRGLDSRIRAVVANMAEPQLPPQSVDLIWSEGALYSIGLKQALAVCRRLLRPGGYLVFTDAVWRTQNPPACVRESFEFDYPTMGFVVDDLAAIEATGLELVAHFTLPDDAWWDDFYTPMEARIEALRLHYAGDSVALSILDQIAEEPAMHRRHAEHYAYECLVTRRC